jgi:hypothetical protein
MPVIDFKEIPTPAHGAERDQFELFASEFLDFLGFRIIVGPDRGPDAGRDLIVEELRTGVAGETHLKWLVSCKHNAHTGASVTGEDERDIHDRVTTHKCQGFIAFYSTLPSSGLAAKLNAANPFEVKVYNSERIERELLKPAAGADLARRFFPKSFAAWEKEHPAPAHLVFESHLADLPTKVPHEGQVHTLPLFYSPDSGGEQITLSVRHGQPGSDLEWFRDLRFPQVYRCEITNYGNAPLLQVVLEFRVEYREVIKDNPSSARSGDIAYSRQWPVLLSKIDPGKGNAAVFFVYNQSRYLAVVIPPEVGSYITLGEKAQRRATLVPIGMSTAMSLWPPDQMK